VLTIGDILYNYSVLFLSIVSIRCQGYTGDKTDLPMVEMEMKLF